jgi:DNA-directed RNA polymerase subunit beta'
LTRNGEISVVDDRGREIESYVVPTGAKLACRRRRQGPRGKSSANGTRTRFPIITEVGGKVRFEDVVEGETMRIEREASGNIAW